MKLPVVQLSPFSSCLPILTIQNGKIAMYNKGNSYCDHEDMDSGMCLLWFNCYIG
jgi:hypothetical protein